MNLNSERYVKPLRKNLAMSKYLSFLWLIYMQGKYVRLLTGSIRETCLMSSIYWKARV